MEDLAPLIIFALLAGFAGLSKLLTQRKEEEARKRNAARRKTRPEDLPEATRRLLYGDKAPSRPVVRDDEVREGQPRVAQPRGAGSRTAQPRVAQPRSGQARQAQRIPAPPRRTAPAQPQHQRQEQGAFRAKEEVARRPRQEARRPAPPMRNHAPSARRKPVQAVRTGTRRHRHVEEGPRPTPKPRPQRRPAPQRQAARPAPVTCPRGPVLNTLAEVRRGIIVAEVLGAPRAFRDLEV